MQARGARHPPTNTAFNVGRALCYLNRELILVRTTYTRQKLFLDNLVKTISLIMEYQYP